MSSNWSREDAVGRLKGIMARLRDPEDGCPWDRQQSFSSIAPYTIEEAYEVDDAIRADDMEGLREELGDLLLQVVYHAQMANEAGHFDFDDVAVAIGDKLVRRHPHVFGDSADRDRTTLRRHWEDAKARERAEKAAARSSEHDGDTELDPFDGVPLALPALMRAAKLIGRAERIGADPGAQADRAPDHGLAALSRAAKVQEEVTADELGAMLFSCVRLARTHGIDPERALRDECADYQAAVRAALKSSGQAG